MGKRILNSRVKSAQEESAKKSRKKNDEHWNNRAREQQTALQNQKYRIHLIATATQSIIETTSREDEVDFLISNFKDWIRFLTDNANTQILDQLIQTPDRLPSKLQPYFKSILPILTLKQFSFTNQFISYDNLLDFIKLAEAAEAAESRYKKITLSLIVDLRQLLRTIEKSASDETPLNTTEVLHLNTIIQDYKKCLDDDNCDTTSTIMYHQLLDSYTLQKLSPILQKTHLLSESLARKAAYPWSFFNKTDIQHQINTLENLNQSITIEATTINQAVAIAKSAYPKQSSCFFSSQTQKLLDQLEIQYQPAPS